jgi:uncharacterized membrane protein
MKAKHFISAIDSAAIASAIRDAETKTSGQIRVFVTRQKCRDPVAAANKHFDVLGMRKTRGRNGILIFVAPRSQTFAIVGDESVHARCGNEFWSTLRDDMRGHLKGERYTEALIHAINKAGELLARHFPSTGDNPDAQPNAVIQD